MAFPKFIPPPIFPPPGKDKGAGIILERRKDVEKRIAEKMYPALRRAKPSERQSVLAKLRGEWESDTSHLLQKDADKVRQKLRKELKKKYPELKF